MLAGVAISPQNRTQPGQQPGIWREEGQERENGKLTRESTCANYQAMGPLTACCLTLVVLYIQVNCVFHVAVAVVAITAALVLMRTHVFDPVVLQDIARNAIAKSNGAAEGVITDVIRVLQGVI